MDLKLTDIVGNIFHTEEKEKEAEDKKRNDALKKLNNNMIARNTGYNPFLNKDGSIFNPYMNYQSLLDSPKISQKAKNYISQATGLTPTQNTVSASSSNSSSGGVKPYEGFNANAPADFLASLDVATELPKLNENQIATIISKHFSKSPVIKPSDATGIFNAQQQTGMSALAILGIGALESGYGTSSIARAKNNLWGWGATNSNPSGNATSFSQMSQGAMEYAKKYMATYYNGYGAKSIYSAGTGNNPSGKGYAYFDNGTINSQWATSVGSIMRDLYNTAKNAN